MTSDAKIGLLLALVFIVVIAFLVNGLPELIGKPAGEGNHPTASITSEEFDSVMLGQNADEAVAAVSPQIEEPAPVVIEEKDDEVNDVRFKTTLAPKALTFEPVEAPKASKSNNKVLVTKVAPTKKTYTVVKGDTLAKIAVKMYGKDEGNKKDTVQSLFEANKKSLKSPDHIVVGQKLTIPPLELGTLEVSSKSAIAQAASTNASKLTALNSQVPQTPRYETYTVKENDTLWKIAERKLGDGAKYTVILELNGHKIRSADDIYAGMSLQIPMK